MTPGCSSRSPSEVPVLTVSFFGEGSPTKIDYRKKEGTLILTSLLEGLVVLDQLDQTSGFERD